MILRAFFWRMKQATPLGVVDAMRQKKAPKAGGSPRRMICGELLSFIRLPCNLASDLLNFLFSWRSVRVA